MTGATPWTGLAETVSPPAWHGGSLQHFLDGRPAVVAGVCKRGRRPRAWRPWTLIQPDTRIPTPAQVAACWRLLRT